ncbi:hypothetical protein CRG98_005051 [Punica granatum]|uniref:Late embryogenesis abundant protein LEA-2 subgroup domain-containing protein n=1 Tax=Punica granatum TaxID=22663 RepID=A0A2I0L1Z0_PUNGR|nr:hypothetical protein CRG98_005051 [Punica granatum]
MARIELEVPPDENRGPRWSLLVKVAGAILSVLVVAFLIARITVISPHKSLFTLEDVTLYGFNVSNSPILITSEDWVINRLVVIMIKLDGQVKWKLGVIAKGSYHITVKCPAYIPFGTNGTGIYVGNNAIKYQLLQRCGVNFSR